VTVSESQPSFFRKISQFYHKTTIFGGETAYEAARLVSFGFGLIYLNLLLHLPRFYLTRVNKVNGDAEISKTDLIQILQVKSRDLKRGREKGNFFDPSNIPVRSWGVQINDKKQVTPAMLAFKETWNDFIDSLLREWNAANIISALLLS
jgi:hypothetical protein